MLFIKDTAFCHVPSHPWNSEQNVKPLVKIQAIQISLYAFVYNERIEFVLHIQTLIFFKH